MPSSLSILCFFFFRPPLSLFRFSSLFFLLTHAARSSPAPSPSIKELKNTIKTSKKQGSKIIAKKM